MNLRSSSASAPEKPRRRAVSKRSLATSLSILDAAERLFAERGYDGASVRDIAKAAGTQIASISFHHVSKETLFERVVERRASELSQLRLDALSALKTLDAEPTLEALLSAFLRPYLEKAGAGDPQWLAYARLVAMVSADARWHRISERCFDPTAGVFIAEIARLFPHADRSTIAVSFIFLGVLDAVAVNLDMADRGPVHGRLADQRRDRGQCQGVFDIAEIARRKRRSAGVNCHVEQHHERDRKADCHRHRTGCEGARGAPACERVAW